MAGVLPAVVLFGVTVLLAYLKIPFTRFIAIGTCALAVGAVVLAFMALAAGFTGAYIYADGLVHSKNGRLQVAMWPEVSEMLLWRAGGKGMLAGKLLAYYLVTFDGRKLAVEARMVDDRDVLGDQLRAIVTHYGRPVVESGPAAGVLRP